MRIRPFDCVLILTAYLPFEDFVLKWLPVTGKALLVLTQLPDVLIIVALLLALADRLHRAAPVRRFGGWIDALIFLFLLSAVASQSFNHGAWLLFLVTIKGLLRYVALGYIILSFPPDEKRRKRFVKVLAFLIVCEVTIGITQFAGGIPVRNFLAARNTTTAIAGFKANYTGTRFQGVNNLMGTMGNTINYGAFMLVGLALLLSGLWKLRHRYRNLLIFLAIGCIYLTNSRSALVATIFVLLFSIAMTRGWRKSLKYATLIAFLILVAAIAIPLGHGIARASTNAASRTRFFDIFSHQYIQVALNQRLGLVVYLLPDFLQQGAHLIYGYSTDPAVFVSAVRQTFPNVPIELILVLRGILDDVYWIALLMYFGIVGFTFFLGIILSSLQKALRTFRSAPTIECRSFALFAVLLLAAAFPLNLFNQVFAIRQYSFFMWIGFALMIVTLRENHANPAGT